MYDLRIGSSSRFMKFGLIALISIGSVLCKGATEVISPNLYAVIETNLGTITAKLFDKEASVTVSNFVGLSEGEKASFDFQKGIWVKRRFYDGLIFHRVIPKFMIQGGCPFGNGTGHPGYFFKDELSQYLRFDRPGRLAMANAGPNTNGSQFFITVVPTPHLNDKHTIFGQVIDGLDVVIKISEVERDKYDKPLEDIVIKRVIIKSVPKKVALIISAGNFRDEEYIHPKEVLTKAGIEVITVSTTLEEVKGMLGMKVKPDLLLKDLNIDDLDGIIFIGGTGASQYWDDKTAHRIVRQAYNDQKIIGAICIAPVILAKATILKNKKATVFAAVKQYLISAGAIYLDEPIQIDGNIITARDPASAKKFAEAILKMF